MNYQKLFNTLFLQTKHICKRVKVSPFWTLLQYPKSVWHRSPEMLISTPTHWVIIPFYSKRSLPPLSSLLCVYCTLSFSDSALFLHSGTSFPAYHSLGPSQYLAYSLYTELYATFQMFQTEFRLAEICLHLADAGSVVILQLQSAAHETFIE